MGLRHFSEWWIVIIAGTILAAVIAVVCFCAWANGRLKWFQCCARRKGHQRTCASCRCCHGRPLSLRTFGPCCCCFVFCARRVKNQKNEYDLRAERKAAKRERLGKGPDDEVSSEDEDNQVAWNEGTVVSGATMYSRERRQADNARERAEEEARYDNVASTSHAEIGMTALGHGEVPPLVQSEVKRDIDKDGREMIILVSPSMSAGRGLAQDPEPEYKLHLEPLMPIPPPLFPPTKPAGFVLGSSRRDHNASRSFVNTTPVAR